MRRAWSLLRGALFYAAFYGGMLLVGALFWIPAARSETTARRVARGFFRGMTRLTGLLAGAPVALRGPVPSGSVVVAAKHQSMLDVMILYAALPAPRFVMKKELATAPIFGWYARRVGCVPVDRSGGKEARDAMVAALTAGGAEGQLVIYPQGTRVAAGARAPYRAGAHALYAETGLACVPAAVNTGAILPRGLALHRGQAVVEFLRPIQPGLERGPFMAILERELESASDALLAETRRRMRREAPEA